VTHLAFRRRSRYFLIPFGRLRRIQRNIDELLDRLAAGGSHSRKTLDLSLERSRDASDEGGARAEAGSKRTQIVPDLLSEEAIDVW
jgi:hypothetical protein